MSYNIEDAEDFLEKVNRIHDQVRDIASGKMSMEEIDRIEKDEKDKELMASRLKEINDREEKERQLKGKPGKGHIAGYKSFCSFCHIEWFVECVFKCTSCGRDTITYEVSLNFKIFIKFAAGENGHIENKN